MQREIADLLTQARESFATVELYWQADYDGALLRRARERALPDLPARLRSGTAARLEAAGPRSGAGERNGRLRHGWRAWWRRPSCWRDDVEWENGARTISIVRDEVSISYSSVLHTLHTNHEPEGRLAALRSRGRFQLPTVESQLRMIPLLDPSFLAGGWELAIGGDNVHAGRAAVHVRARWRGAGMRPEFWEGVDEYDLLADRERGVLLRYAGMVDGEEAGVFSVRAVRFDEPIPDDVFTLRPPPGTRVVSV